MNVLLNGKTALVSGGASGIGFATAQLFIERGASVVIADHNVSLGNLAVQKLQKMGDVSFIAADVKNNEQVNNLIEKTLAKYQRIDFACNNAGIINPYQKITEYSEADWDNVMNTNLKGIWLCMKYQIPVMLAQSGGAIVNIASTYGLRGASVDYAYVASKHAIVGLTKSLALDYAQENIRINAVCPGAIDTPLFNLPAWTPESLAKKLDTVPMKRLGRPEEIAKLVVWLCTDEASFMTGSTLVADGGLLTY